MSGEEAQATWGVEQEEGENSFGSGLSDARDVQGAYDQQWREATVPGAQRPATVTPLWRPQWDRQPKPVDPRDLGRDAQPAPEVTPAQVAPPVAAAPAVVPTQDNSLLILILLAVGAYFLFGKK